jgi:hypothetical protein
MFHFSKKQIIFAAIVVLACIGIPTVLFSITRTTPREIHTIDAYAQEMVALCKDASYRPLCYETEVPKLVSVLPTERIFDVVRAIRNYDSEYLYCHVLAHNLGEYEVSLDPENWLDVLATGPTDGLCSNGFAHGAIVTRFNDEELSKEEFDAALTDLKIACEEREGFTPTDLGKAICYHGIGHVLIHMTLAKVSESLEACEIISLKDDGRDYRQVCTEGVYMQLFQPLEPEDYALVDMLPYVPTKENITQFCSDFSGNDRQYGACWREAWPLLGQSVYEGEGIMEYCSALTPSQDRGQCFVSAFTINGRHGLGTPEKMAETCNSVAQEYQGMCFARGANAFPEENPDLVKDGVAFCGRANAEEAKDECYTFLAQVASFNFHHDSPAFEELCSTLPSAYENRCRGM